MLRLGEKIIEHLYVGGDSIPSVYMGNDIIYSTIYGASWNKTSNPVLTRTNAAITRSVNVGVDSQAVLNEFDTSDLFKSFTKVTDDYGNIFVRIPRIYIRKTDSINLKTWQVSLVPFADAYLPWCFWDFANGKALDYIDVGAHLGSLSTDGTRLESKAGVYPLAARNIVQFRTLAQANGARYQQLDIHVVDLLQTLFIIEQATLNSQSKIMGYTSGQYSASHTATVAETATNRIIVATATATLFEIGQTISIGTSLGGNQIFYGRTITAKTTYDASNVAISFDGASVNIAVGNIIYNTAMRTGFSSNIASSVGSISSNTSGKKSFAWHGIESLYGDIYQFVDGVNINNNQAWVCPNASSYTSNLFTAPYEQLSYVNGATSGYITTLGRDISHPYAEYPVSIGGSNSTYYGDYYYQASGQFIALLGGYWVSGAFAGLFYWDLGYSSSNSYLNFGGRLIRKPL